MSDSLSENTCPGCGAAIRVIEGKGPDYATIIYECEQEKNLDTMDGSVGPTNIVKPNPTSKNLKGWKGDGEKIERVRSIQRGEFGPRNPQLSPSPGDHREETMTPEELQELRNWSARKMGWKRVYADDIPMWKLPGGRWDVVNWQPDNPKSGQTWMLVERMRELGFNFLIEWHQKYHKTYFAVFWVNPDGHGVDKDIGKGFSINPCLAILLAAKATEKKP